MTENGEMTRKRRGGGGGGGGGGGRGEEEVAPEMQSDEEGNDFESGESTVINSISHRLCSALRLDKGNAASLW